MKETLKEFMEDYRGFDWDNGKLVIVTESHQPFIISGGYSIILKHHLNDVVGRFTHDDETMVITLEEE